MAALADLLARLDPDPYRRGKQFEHICKWFLAHDPVYSHELRRVWLWDEWPGRWGIDAGIDLVAEDHRGNLWAIQVKAYDAAYSITKQDVDSFLSESGRAEFSFRLLIATTNHIGANAKRTIEKQENQAVRWHLWGTIIPPDRTFQGSVSLRSSHLVIDQAARE